MKILRWIGVIALLLALGAAGAYALRSDPLGPLAGKRLAGPVVSEPVSDWSFTDEHYLIAVETRPAAPHSVTTICFAHEGSLYVPAQGGSAKDWTHFAVSNPRVRLKIGDKVYPAIATRITDPDAREAMVAAARAKYDFDGGDTPPEDIWLFRMDSVAVDVAAAP
jgi:hypothetical protein